MQKSVQKYKVLDLDGRGTSRENFILEKQDKEEKNQESSNALRFFRPYNSDNFYKNNRYLKPESLEIIKTAKLPSREKYDKLSEKEKTKVFSDILKDLAVLSARRANLANREKNSENNKSGGKYAYGNKDKHMTNFLIRAHMHNQLVTPEEQIYFGFNYQVSNNKVIGKDGKEHLNYLMTLDASIPGYSRLSVHFGRMEMPILKGANKELEKMGFAKFPIDKFEEKNYDRRKDEAEKAGREFKPRNAKDTILKLCKSMPYNLDKYALNLGLILRDDYNNAEKYAKQIKEMATLNDKFNETGLKDFIYCTGVKLNIREIMYLAERAGLGKRILIDIQEKTKERGEFISKPIRVTKNYFDKRLNESKTDDEKLKTLSELSNAYFKGLELEDDQIVWAEKVNSFINQLPGNIDKNILTKWFATMVENVLKNDATDCDKVAEVLPYISEGNKETLNNVFHQYTDGDMSEVFFTLDDEFRRDALKRTLMFVDEENRTRIHKYLEELGRGPKFIDDINGIYDQILKIANASEPVGRDEAEAMEQYLLDINKEKGE